MTREELEKQLTELRQLEKKLRSYEVENFLRADPIVDYISFISYRSNISAAIGQLTNAQLTDIANDFDKNTAELGQAIGQLDTKIEVLKEAVVILQLIAKVADLAAKIAANAK